MARIVDRDDVYIAHNIIDNYGNEYVHMMSLGTLLCNLKRNTWDDIKAEKQDVCLVTGSVKESFEKWDFDTTVVVNLLPDKDDD